MAPLPSARCALAPSQREGYLSGVLSSPPSRRGFSLTEIMVVLALVGVLTGVSTFFLGESAEEGAEISVQSELERLSRALQAKSLTVPGYDFPSLAAALSAKEAPIDPWGQPYLLLHPTRREDTQDRDPLWPYPERDQIYREGPGPHPPGIQVHILLSTGPDRMLDTVADPAGGDDRWVELKLGRPVLDPGSSSNPPLQGPPGPWNFECWDQAAQDQDQISVYLDGTPLGSNLNLSATKLQSLGQALGVGTHELRIEAKSEGSLSSVTPGLRVRLPSGAVQSFAWSAPQGSSRSFSLEVVQP